MGEFVENLLVKAEYGEGNTKFTLPRIPLGVKAQITKRILLHQQSRQRYVENIDAGLYREAGVAVEVCSVDGEWRSGLTTEAAGEERNKGCQEVLVKYADGEEEHVSLGRVIVAGDSSA